MSRERSPGTRSTRPLQRVSGRCLGTVGGADNPRRLPPRVALVGLPAELGAYLCDWFGRHWPEARVILRHAGQQLVADVVVVDQLPPSEPKRPTLWLAEIDRSQTVIRLGPRLWRTAMPTTPRRLKHALETCLDSRA